LAEFFDIRGGKVARIYAVMRYLKAAATDGASRN
jgi:hypothetical protein